MRVDLGRCDAAMPQQTLDEPDVHATFDKLRRRGVAEHVGGDLAWDCRLGDGVVQASADIVGGGRPCGVTRRWSVEGRARPRALI